MFREKRKYARANLGHGALCQRRNSRVAGRGLAALCAVLVFSCVCVYVCVVCLRVLLTCTHAIVDFIGERTSTWIHVCADIEKSTIKVSLYFFAATDVEAQEVIFTPYSLFLGPLAVFGSAACRSLVFYFAVDLCSPPRSGALAARKATCNRTRT